MKKAWWFVRSFVGSLFVRLLTSHQHWPSVDATAGDGPVKGRSLRDVRDARRLSHSLFYTKVGDFRSRPKLVPNDEHKARVRGGLDLRRLLSCVDHQRCDHLCDHHHHHHRSHLTSFDQIITMRVVVAVSFLTFVSGFSPVAFQGRSSVLGSSFSSSSLMMSEGNFDFDVAIIGCGVGGHGAALHSRAQKLKTAVFAGGDVGGTCVNRGCVPSKALLAASGRVREMQNTEHLKSMGIEVPEVKYDRAGIAAHAKNLANRVKGNLEASLVGLGVDVIEGRGVLTGKPHEIKDEATGKIYTAKVCSCS